MQTNCLGDGLGGIVAIRMAGACGFSFTASKALAFLLICHYPCSVFLSQRSNTHILCMARLETGGWKLEAGNRPPTPTVGHGQCHILERVLPSSETQKLVPSFVHVASENVVLLQDHQEECGSWD